MARVADPSGRGEVAYVLQWAYLVAPVLAVGLHRTLLRGGERTKDLLGLMGLPLLLGAVGGGLVFAITQSTSVVASAAIAVGFAGLSVVRGSWVGRGKSLQYALLAIATSIVYLIGGAVLYSNQVASPKAWIIPYLIPAAAVMIFGGWALVSRRPLPTRADLRGGVPQALGSLAQIIATRLDRIILPLVAGYAALGVYVVPATALEAALWPVVAVSDHKVSAWRESRRRDGSIREVVGNLWWIGLIVLGLSITTWILIRFLLPEAYHPGLTVLPELAVAAVMVSLSTLASARILAGPRPNRVALIEFGRMGAGVLVYPPMIVNGGIQGAAWATLIVYSIGAAIAGVALRSTSLSAD